MKTQIFKNRWLMALLVLIAVALIGLRAFYHLSTTPGWFADEGVNLDIANNLLHGQALSYAVTYSFVPHPPLFFVLASFAVAILGKSIISIRIISALAGLATVYFTYLLAENLIQKKSLAIITGVVAFAYPVAIISSRLGLTYSVFTALATACFVFLTRFYNQRKDKDFAFAALLASLSTVTSPLGLVLVAICLGVGWKLKNLNLKGLLCLFSPIVIYITVFGLRHYPAFFQDIVFLISRVSRANNPEAVGVTNMIGSTIGESSLALLGFIGLMTLRNKYKFILPVTFLICVTFELMTKGPVSFGGGTYFGIIFLPIGVALLFDTLHAAIKRHGFKFWAMPVLYLLTTAVILFPFSLTMKKIINGRFIGTKQEEWFSFDNFESAEQAAAYVNERTNSDSVVMSSPQFAILLNAKTFDPMQASSYDGNETSYYPANFRSRGRYIYGASYLDANYLVVDKTTKNWYAFQVNVREYVLDRFWNNWPIIFANDEFTIFKNPEK